MANIKLSDKTCDVEGCARRDLVGEQFCSLHYQRIRRGKPLGGPDRRIAEKGAPTLMRCGALKQCPAGKKLAAHMDYVRNADVFKARAQERNRTHKEHIKQVNAARYQTAPDVVKAKVKAWQKANPERYRANNARSLAKYREYIRRATPSWVNQAEIDAIYMACPKGWHVDHIVPIQGELVSGLHVPWNLQYLTASDNSAKRNRFDPDSPDRIALMI